MKTKRTYLFHFSLIVFLVLSTFFMPVSQAAQAQGEVVNPPPVELTGRVRRAAAEYLSVPRNRLRVSDVMWEDAWAAGYLVVRAQDTADPDLYIFVAYKEGDVWQVALEGQAGYDVLFNDAPFEIKAPFLFDETLLQESFTDPDGLPREAFSDSDVNPSAIWQEQPELSFPWTGSYAWKFTGGPHNNEGAATRPWSSLDFSPGTSGKWEVRAAAPGYVQISTSCKNFVLIKHTGGWQTGYYHLTEIKVTNGQYVSRGAYLGKASALSGCGGSAKGAHVHFSLRKSNVKQEWKGRYIGGYLVKEGASQYAGTLVRAATGAKVQIDSNVRNQGMVGLGTPVTPAPIAPLGTAYNTPVTFSWSAAGGATSYYLQVATDVDFSSPVVSTPLLGISTTVATLTDGTTYYWRVRGENYSNVGAWSATQTFILDTTTSPPPTPTPPPTPVPPAPIVISPTLTPAFGSTCTTAWYKVAGTGYNGTNVYLTMNTNVASQSTNGAIWRPTIPTSGRYRVEAYIGHHTAFTWPCTPKNYLASDTTQARYKVFHPAATSGTSVYINQRPLDNAWASLGEFYFDAGTTGYVQLKDLNGETNLSRTISFNVVRFTWVGP